ncbi:MAG: hypothetical protein V1874_14065 [Spirochaetota bacterium]
MLTLKNFGQVIDKTILQRGEDYYQYGFVTELEETTADYWTATVQGTEDYTVKVRIKEGEIVESLCNCPYDMGPVCKHEVAVYYAINAANENNVIEFPAKKAEPDRKSKSLKKKTPTVSEKIDSALNKIQPDELKAFVKEYALDDKFFRNALFVRMPADDSGVSLKMYKDIIRSALNSGKDRHGFIDYRHAPGATRPVYDLMTKADKFFADGKFSQVMEISITIIQEMVKAIQFMDDSDGMVTELVNGSLELLENCATAIAGTDTGKEFFNLCLKEARNKIYDGWEFKWDFAHIASLLINSENDIDAVFQLLDELTKKEKVSNYDLESTAYIKLDIIKKWYPGERLEQYINDNMQYTEIRKASIERAIKTANYSLAKKLACEGIEKDEAKAPGLVKIWKRYLLTVAEKLSDKKDIIEKATELFYDTGDFTYYNILKDQYAQKEWENAFPILIDDIKKNARYRDTIFPSIYIQEEKWKDLLEHVAQNQNKYILESCHKYLAKLYPKELSQFYEKAVLEELKFTGRNHYQEACKMLRKMKKLGASARVEELKRNLKEEYKNRPALLEELADI